MLKMNFKKKLFQIFSFLIVTLTMLSFGGRTANAKRLKTADNDNHKARNQK